MKLVYIVVDTYKYNLEQGHNNIDISEGQTHYSNQVYEI